MKPTVLIAALALLAGCAAPVTAPDPGVRQAIAPSGKLRVGVYQGSPTSIIRDPAGGEAKGLSHDLGRQLADRLGVPVELVEFPRVAAVVDAIKDGKVDFTVTNATPARAKDVDFTPSILSLELGYLAPPRSTLTDAAQVDRPGIRIGVTQGSTTQATLGRTLKQVQLVPATSVKDAVEMLSQGKLDLYATNKAILHEMRDQLPGSRILEGRWGLEHMGIAYPKGREAGKAYLDAFAAEAVSSGRVRKSADRAGLRGTADAR